MSAELVALIHNDPDGFRLLPKPSRTRGKVSRKTVKKGVLSKTYFVKFIGLTKIKVD